MVLSNAKAVILDRPRRRSIPTEAVAHAFLDRFLLGRTTPISAHRLSSVRRADRVLAVDGGEIIEEGQHEDLAANNGLHDQPYGTQHHH
jgi:ABC-type multidrug transport system fused ATPase/permease subunit